MEILMALSSILLATLRLGTPLIFTSMGGLMSERSGVINIALEGFMLWGAFVGAVVGHYTSNAWLAWIMAFIGGVLFAICYALFVIELRADQIVTGMAFNLFIMGVIPFLTKILFNSTGSTPALTHEGRFTFEPLVIGVLVVIFIAWWMNKTRAGLWLLFAGEHPKALQSSGVSLRFIRWFAVMTSGGLAAWGGASLSLYLSSSYSPQMTGGRGFMSLAALIFGKWRPIPTFIACLLFAFADALQIRLQGIHISGYEIPVQFIQILPYILTVIALAGFMGASNPPKALGKSI